MGGIDLGLVLGVGGAVCGALMAALGLVLSRAPGWAELRSFALVAITASAYCVFALIHVVPASDQTHLLGDRLTLAASFAYGLVWIRHLAIAAKRPLKRWERATMVIGSVLVVLALIPEVMIVQPVRRVTVEWFGVTYMLASGTLLALVGVAFIVVTTCIAAFRTGQRWSDGWHARLPVLCAVALAVTGVFDTLGSLEIVPIPQLIEAVTIVVVGAMGASYTRRFIDDARRLEALSADLERQVAARTSELLEAQALAVAQERLAILGRIAAGVAHEINNPAAVIQHNVDLLRVLLAERGLLSPELAARLDDSRTATRRIADIVRLLLETSRGHAVAHTNTVAFRVEAVVERAVAAASITAPDLQVTVHLADGLCARAEPGSLEQVLINLVVNAAQATREVDGGGHVRIEGERRDNRVLLRVIDNGPGIPASIRDRLFEPFSTTKPTGEGTGLGLAVSRGLVTRHGGSLSVEATSSDGTVMAIELPAADESEMASPVAAAAHVESPSQTKARDTLVLVIEDDDDLREVLTLHLDRFFHVTPAATVDEAVAIVRTRSYDAVLCDVMMPGGGAEVWLAQCAQIDPLLEERTILLTGGPTTAAAASLLEQRADKVLFKPFELTELRPLIERVVSPRP